MIFYPLLLVPYLYISTMLMLDRLPDSRIVIRELRLGMASLTPKAISSIGSSKPLYIRIAHHNLEDPRYFSAINGRFASVDESTVITLEVADVSDKFLNLALNISKSCPSSVTEQKLLKSNLDMITLPQQVSTFYLCLKKLEHRTLRTTP